VISDNLAWTQNVGLQGSDTAKIEPKAREIDFIFIGRTGIQLVICNSLRRSTSGRLLLRHTCTNAAGREDCELDSRTYLALPIQDGTDIAEKGKSYSVEKRKINAIDRVIR
jgi:hypothetical protein